jgi:hypothetical protein
VASFRGSRGPLSRAEGSAGNELKLVVVLVLDFWTWIADIGISHHPGRGEYRVSFEVTLSETASGVKRPEDDDEHENVAA